MWKTKNPLSQKKKEFREITYLFMLFINLQMHSVEKREFHCNATFFRQINLG